MPGRVRIMAHNKPNPTNNAMLQMCLDLKKRGYGNLIEDLYTKLSSDADFLNECDAMWRAHRRPNASITYVQHTLHSGLEYLSPYANKLFILLAEAAAAAGLVQASLPDLVYITGMSRTSIQRALRELRECGAISIKETAKQHAATVYEINPCISCVGDNNAERRKKDYKPDIQGNLNILNREDTYTTEYVKSDTMYYAVIKPLQHTADGIKKDLPSAGTDLEDLFDDN